MRREPWIAASLFLFASPLHAEEEEPSYEEDIPAQEAEAAPAPSPISGEERTRAADQQFDGIMNKNVFVPKAPPAATLNLPVIAVEGAPSGASISDARTVEVPLARWEQVRAELRRAREAQGRAEGPAVILGAAEYSGEGRQGALALRLELEVTLGRPGKWKTVPLVGDDVVVVSAKDGGTPIPVTREAGYHVWITDKAGQATLTLELLVPARGPRGSIEYDFLAARTPVTRFRCRFPVAGLEPRIDAAVRSELASEGASTVLTASLRPTTRIHLVGFRDLGDTSEQKAKVYAESLNLLSIDESAYELFTVIRYTILYGGTKDFQVEIPPGMSVVSAEGEGAFRYTVEKVEGATVLKGETAFPIRNGYEISLRLHREAKKGAGGESFEAPIPRTRGVEREHGWLGVEVPGKLRLEEEKRNDVLAIDVRQLPGEMVESAVSPILKAYRYHGAGASVTLAAARLPEKDPASASVDRIRAVSVISPEGKLLTDLKITLRNRLRHTLILSVPKDAEVLSTLLDGQPVKPSRNEAGQLMLPLMRSAGGDRMLPFTLQVVVEGKLAPMGFFGAPDLWLPAVDLPVSSLGWTVYLPARNVYSALRADVSPEVYAGEAGWNQASSGGWAGGDGGGATGGAAHLTTTPIAAASADTGAMPVRIKLPESGVRLEYSRYWIEASSPVRVSVTYLRRWLIAPIAILLALAFAAGLLLLAESIAPSPAGARPAMGAAIMLLLIWPLAKLGGSVAVIAGVVVGAAVVVVRRGWLPRASSSISEWARTLGERWTARERTKRSFFYAAGKLALAFAMFVALTMIVARAAQLVSLLGRPLAG